MTGTIILPTGRNRVFDEIAVGDRAAITRTCTANDLFVFAHASGSLNPLHIPEIDHTGDGIPDRALAPSMWSAMVISSVLGNVLPGPGTVYRSQNFTFHQRAREGDTLTFTVEITGKKEPGLVDLATTVTREDGTLIAEGLAQVEAPKTHLAIEPHHLPHILLERFEHFDRLIAAAATLPPLPTAVIMPDDANSLTGALLAAQKGLIAPLLIGPEAGIRNVAHRLDLTLEGIEILDAITPDEATQISIDMARRGRVAALMKGHLHTDTLLHRLVEMSNGLKTTRRISHVFVMDIAQRATPLLITDAAINISPDLKAKVDITQNVIDLAHAIGIENPKVGILSAVETVTPAIPSTLDAAILSKMAERGQIRGGIVDGPLAMDNAVDAAAARTKGITSLVAGHADALVVPNMEAGNMLAKELTFLAHARSAGLVVGCKVPVILTSRADDDYARLASCALARLYDYWRSCGLPLAGQEKHTQEGGAPDP